MNRKKLIAVALSACVLIASLSSVFVFTKNRENSKRLAQEKIAIVPTPVVEKLAEWKDPAGFSFSYPEGLTVDKHDEDQENYAHVEMTLKDKPGNVIVWAKDAPISDLATWVKKEKRFTNAPVLDTTLGGENAKKILLNSPKKMVIVGALYDGMLVSVESELDEAGEWQKRHESVVSSLVFGEKKTTGSSVSSSDSSDEGSDVSIDEEEVIE
ncbi:hypothetical protein HY947_05075 [Candidatus Gottesmanbacteria bacterium]|nr:hypothetical protein [Candidatus Gottesmanbacteria bacterium]